MTSFNNGILFPLDLPYFLRYGPVFHTLHIYIFILEEFPMKGLSHICLIPSGVDYVRIISERSKIGHRAQRGSTTQSRIN